MVSLNSTATTPRIEVVGPSRSLLHSEPKINQKLDRFILATNVTENHKRPRLLNDSRSLNLFIRQFSCYSNGNEKSGTKNPEQHLGPISTTEFSFVWDDSGFHRIRNRLKFQKDHPTNPSDKCRHFVSFENKNNICKTIASVFLSVRFQCVVNLSNCRFGKKKFFYCHSIN